MKTQQIQEAQHYLTRLQELDKEIAELVGNASEIANGNMECSFTIKLENKHAEVPENMVDNYGSQVPTNILTSALEDLVKRNKGLSYSIWGTDKKEQEIKNQLSEATTLKILAILLEDKNRRREEVLRELKKLGVD